MIILQPNIWYRIPGFNGYELQLLEQPNYHPRSYPVNYKGNHLWFWLRSYKNFKKYPNGYILPYEHGNGKNKEAYYEMTDISNNRKRIKIGDIVKYIETSSYITDIGERVINRGSRNSIVYRTDKAQIGLSDVLGKSSLVVPDEPVKKMVQAIHFDI